MRMYTSTHSARYKLRRRSERSRVMGRLRVAIRTEEIAIRMRGVLWKTDERGVNHKFLFELQNDVLKYWKGKVADVSARHTSIPLGPGAAIADTQLADEAGCFYFSLTVPGAVHTLGTRSGAEGARAVAEGTRAVTEGARVGGVLV